MKKDFFTGLILLLPFALTLIIVTTLINLFTSPFQGFIESILSYYDILDEPFFIFTRTQVLHFNSKILALISLFLFIILIGFLGQMLFLKALLNLWDFIIQRIPFINRVHKATKEVVNTVFGPKKSAFDRVVLIPFPTANAYSIGLLSKEQSTLSTGETIAVFVPGSPNPTMGFMLTYKYEELIFTTMTVEEAFKFIVSFGIMFPGFQSGQRSENPDNL